MYRYDLSIIFIKHCELLGNVQFFISNGHYYCCYYDELNGIIILIIVGIKCSLHQQALH